MENLADKEEMVQVKRNLDKVKANIVWTILNGSSKDRNEYYYGDDIGEKSKKAKY